MNSLFLVMMSTANINNWTFVIFITFLFSLGFVFFLLFKIRKNNKANINRQRALDEERRRSDELLLNILPAEIAEELKQYGAVKAKNYERVSILFSDFKNFSGLTKLFSPSELVAEIDYVFKAFDHILSQYSSIEKIKTIGDAYMAASGLNYRPDNSEIDIIRAASEMTLFMQEYEENRKQKGQPFFELRIGIHTGPVIAGVVGVNKFAFDLWGDTVNIAARMEGAGEVGKINISRSTYDFIKNEKKFQFENRGEAEVKNIGKVGMYFVEYSDN